MVPLRESMTCTVASEPELSSTSILLDWVSAMFSSWHCSGEDG